jgi:hypothetical protein
VWVESGLAVALLAAVFLHFSLGRLMKQEKIIP